MEACAAASPALFWLLSGKGWAATDSLGTASRAPVSAATNSPSRSAGPASRRQDGPRPNWAESRPCSPSASKNARHAPSTELASRRNCPYSPSMKPALAPNRKEVASKTALGELLLDFGFACDSTVISGEPEAKGRRIGHRVSPREGLLQLAGYYIAKFSRRAAVPLMW